jgi:hypothetical protein
MGGWASFLSVAGAFERVFLLEINVKNIDDELICQGY